MRRAYHAGFISKGPGGAIDPNLKPDFDDSAKNAREGYLNWQLWNSALYFCGYVTDRSLFDCPAFNGFASRLAKFPGLGFWNWTSYGIAPGWGNPAWRLPDVPNGWANHMDFVVRENEIVSPKESYLFLESRYTLPPSVGQAPPGQGVWFVSYMPKSEEGNNLHAADLTRHGQPGLVPHSPAPRGEGGMFVAFADGHVKWQTVAQLREIRHWRVKGRYAITVFSGRFDVETGKQVPPPSDDHTPTQW